MLSQKRPPLATMAKPGTDDCFGGIVCSRQKRACKNKILHSLPWIMNLGSLVMWLANDFHSWLRQSWKSLVFTRDFVTREIIGKSPHSWPKNSLFTVTHALYIYIHIYSVTMLQHPWCSSWKMDIPRSHRQQRLILLWTLLVTCLVQTTTHSPPSCVSSRYSGHCIIHW